MTGTPVRARRQQADQVGLVAVAAEDVGTPFPQPARQLATMAGRRGLSWVSVIVSSP